MGELIWSAVRSDLPVTLVLLTSLILVIARRRRLGRAARTAIAGCVVLCVAIAAGEAWAVYHYHFYFVPALDITSPNFDFDELGRQASLADRLDPAVRVVVLLAYLVGLYLLIDALFVGRRQSTGAER